MTCSQHKTEHGGGVAQSVERTTTGEESWVRFLLWLPAPNWLGRCQYNVTGRDRTEKSWSSSSVSCVAARKNCQTLCLGARPRYNLVIDEDVKKPNKQTNKTEQDRTCQTQYIFLKSLPQTLMFLLATGFYCEP